MKIKTEIINVLNQSRVQGNKFFLEGKLDRKTYLDVNKVLESIGGEWNKREKCHIFKCDVEDILAEIINTGEFEPALDKKKVLNFFPTPAKLARRLVELAEVNITSKVLEPSAGRGAIIDALAPFTSSISFVEIDKGNYDYCCLEFIGERVGAYNGDFLTPNLFKNNSFDRVVMNPPFAIKGSPQCDIDHVRRAFEYLKPGGILVSVVSESPFFRENSKSVLFRQWLNELDAEIFDLPSGEFKESGTMVKTRIIKIKK